MDRTRVLQDRNGRWRGQEKTARWAPDLINRPASERSLRFWESAGGARPTLTARSTPKHGASAPRATVVASRRPCRRSRWCSSLRVTLRGTVRLSLATVPA